MADRVVPLSRQTAYVPHARCQNCNKPGHWTHECTAGVQTFTARPTKNKKKLNEELPPEVKVSQLLQDTYHDGKPLHGLGAEGSANGVLVDPSSTAMVATSASIDGTKAPGSAGGNGHTGGSSSLEHHDVGNGKHTATGRASGEVDLNASDTRVIEEHRRDSAGGGGPHHTDKRDKDQRSPGSPGMRVRGRGNVRGRGAAHFSANDADNFFHKRLTQEERLSMEENSARAGLGMLGNKGGKGGGNKGKGKLYGNPNASYQQHHQKMADHRGPAGSQHDDGFRSSYKMNADNDRREHTPQNKRIELLPRVRSPTHGHAAPPPGRGNDSRRAAGTTSGSHHINQRQYPGATRGRHPPRSSNRSVADSSSSDDKNSDSSESESDSSSDSGQSARADHVQDVRRPMSSHNSTRVGGAGGNLGKKDRSAANSRSDGLRERETVATNKQHKEQAAAHAAASTTKGNTTISDRAAALRDRMKAAGTLRDRDEDARAGGGAKDKKPASKVAEKSENVASKKRPRSGSRKHVRKERSATASSDQSDSGDEESAEQKPPKLKPKQARKMDNDKDQQRSMKSAAAGKDDRGRGSAKSNGNPISGNQDRDRRTGASNQDRKDTKQDRGDHTKTRSRDRGEKQPKNKSGTSSATSSNTKDNKNSSGAGRATRAQSGDHAGGKTARAAGGRAPAPATSSRNAGQQGHNKNKNTSRGNKNKMNNRDQESESESSESGSSESEGSESASESSGSSSSSESEQPRAKRARKN